MSSNKIAILIEETQLQSLQALGVKLEVIDIPNVDELQEKYTTLLRSMRRLKEETQGNLNILNRTLEVVGEK